MSNLVRAVLGVATGAVVWMVGFYALTTMLVHLWPDYALHAREWLRAGAFTFTAAMACCNLLLWVLAEIGAGWVAARIAKRPDAVRILAGLVGIYLAAVHLVMYWPRFPWWYNLGVVIPAAPAVLLGARLANPSSGQTR